jgi:kynurenine formamidase
MSADRLPVERLVAPLVVVSIADRAVRDADTQVSVDDLLQWEKRHGRIPPGAFVAMDAGWDARAATADRFLNRDAKGTMHTPGPAGATVIIDAPKHEGATGGPARVLALV